MGVYTHIYIFYLIPLFLKPPAVSKTTQKYTNYTSHEIRGFQLINV
jgi:hypothetical protein